jgi:hypothetical protein
MVDNIQDSDMREEQEWLQAATSNPAFEFLKDQEEDIYTLSDGKPFNNEDKVVPRVEN